MDDLHAIVLSGTLQPLPQSLRHGLSIVASFGLLSLTSSLTLFVYLSYRLITWRCKDQLSHGANQFLILVYNLLIADIQQAAAFAITIFYVANDKIEVGSPTCAANGWFISIGDLASSVFIFGIALHTFFAVVKGHTVSDRTFYLWLICAWAFVYALGVLTVTMLPGGYVRAGAWCWIKREYHLARFLLHYLWMFVCMLGTIVTYALIYMSLRAKAPSDGADNSEPMPTKGAAKQMVLYPFIYVVCTLPLAGGRMAAMTGVLFPYWYYCLAGAAVTSCGWLDVILYILTRRVLMFGQDPPSKSNTGLHTFGWYDGSELYGTTTTIEGPITRKKSWARRPTMLSIEVTPTWPPWRPRKDSDEEYYASPMEGVITTKTTIEVTSGPVDADRVESDLDDDLDSHAKGPRSSG